MDQQEYIDELIIKCLSGEAGVDESKELSRWMDADKEHLAYFLKMKNIWDISHPAFDIAAEMPRRSLRYKGTKCPASSGEFRWNHGQ